LAKKPDENYASGESHRRFEAALRGARVAGPQHRAAPDPKQAKASRAKSPKRAAKKP